MIERILDEYVDDNLKLKKLTLRHLQDAFEGLKN